MPEAMDPPCTSHLHELFVGFDTLPASSPVRLELMNWNGVDVPFQSTDCISIEMLTLVSVPAVNSLLADLLTVKFLPASTFLSMPPIGV